ncbi:hypothetical protein P4159_05680 [Bacillus thuringiensis]|uniref:hypothetical protein n=1 Tax=Bacillus cereus group TaxID=86661 RepID=UPI000CD90876|nr:MULTISPECIES: hypothetical protein [Bacillus cereus group]MEC3596918.1 hypothetical protein [Bacillus thuringiensis]MED1574267.1 hypothetical protein [Bacillus paranthracis]MED1836191.1 hypothetical protein [Bacillus thuringiensis]MED2670254.1 hypothetical protein [Bacillus thuringiensis]MED2694213.1 hypothetical protein [Bacillus thuringiensis]
MKRYELLEKAQRGLIKRGDKFTDGVNEIVFNGGDFRHTDDGTRLWLAISNRDWKPVPKTITVELTQEQVNTIYSLANNAGEQVIRNGNHMNYETVSTWNIFHKFEDLYKRVGGTK